ncbi:MAG TPA: hypothetical protein ENK06_00865 [Gammaproteobacteria bacterium]|nr:hypothetical protein [Gammaproteobacteria bacterium]
MMVRANASNLSTVQVGTPITSLLAEMTAAQKANFYANESDLAESFATLDFLDFSDSSTLSDEQRLVLLKLALRIHKIADAIAGRLDASLAQGSDSGFFGVKEGIPVDASTYVYRAIAEAITADLGITAILTDKAIMAGVISNAWAKMTTVVSDYNALQKDSKKYLIPAVDPDFTSIAADVDQLASAVATVFTDSLGADGSYSKSDDAKARIRAIDVIATLVRSNANPLGLSNAVSLLSDADYMANLKSPKVDMAGLKTKFKNATTATSVSADGANYDSRESFSNLLSANASAAGLTGADGGAVNDQGFAGNSMEINDKDASGNVENGTKVTFEGDTADATSGTMTIDATFASGDFAKKDENGDPEPLSLQGTWEQLDEYTMLMNVEVAGVVEPVIVKPTLTDDGKTAYYFDLGGEQQIWVP